MLEKFKNMGKALKDAQNMKGMMEKVQKELEATVIPVSELNGKIKIEITGELRVNKFVIDPSLLSPDQKKTLEKAVRDAFSKGIKEAKDLATTKLQSVTGGLFGG